MTEPTPNSPVNLDLLSATITAIWARTAVSLRSRARMSPRCWTAIWRRTFPAASGGADAGQDGGGLARGELAAQAARGELGQQPVQPACRLGAGRDKFLAAVTQQPQRGQRTISGHLQDTVCLQGGQPDRDRVIAVGLPAMAAGEHPDPRGELGGHVRHRLAAGNQMLGQRPARAMVALHRLAARLPLPGEPHQLFVAGVCVRELALIDRVRVAGSSTTSVLQALCGYTAISTPSFTSSSSGH